MDGTTSTSSTPSSRSCWRSGARSRWRGRPGPASTSSTPRPARVSRPSPRPARRACRSTARRSTSTRASTPSTTRRRAGSARTPTRRSSSPRTRTRSGTGSSRRAVHAGHRRVPDAARHQAPRQDHRGRHRRQRRRGGADRHRAAARAWSSAACRSPGSPTSPRRTRRGSSGSIRRKGVIAPGSDADLVLIDPSVRKTLTRDDFHVSDYSPWEGWAVSGLAGDDDPPRQDHRRARPSARQPDDGRLALATIDRPCSAVRPAETSVMADPAASPSPRPSPQRGEGAADHVSAPLASGGGSPDYAASSIRASTSIRPRWR